uniref:PH domain-containing protein n=1 Tax=Cyprinodon variegatus TaxID=28743 RepID=A0A3Q2E807_CYPVA
MVLNQHFCLNLRCTKKQLPFHLLRQSGFIFKQWKKRFLRLTPEGSLLVCHDALSPPHQIVLLQSNCEAIVEGKEILDLPKLPTGGSRDSCFALILTQNKYLLLLADTSADCRWQTLILMLLIVVGLLFNDSKYKWRRITFFFKSK